MGLQFKHEGGHAHTFKQSLVDAEPFIGHDPGGHGGLHADDLRIAFGSTQMQDLAQNIFTFGSWEELPFVFRSKEVGVADRGRAHVGSTPLRSRRTASGTRGRGHQGGNIGENRSVWGALVRLCTQPRPDLSPGVCMA